MTGRTTAGTTPTSTPTDDQERTRWQAFWVCVGVAALTILDLSKVNVGLPSIEESLGAGSTDLPLMSPATPSRSASRSCRPAVSATSGAAG